MTPDFSVIVPVYEVEPYLRPCVDSILGQTYRNFELFLVDDGSPDGCGAICDEYAQKDSRVQVIHQPNSGVVTARKAALDRARAEYVCFVDGDDAVVPHWLQTIHDGLQEHGRPDMLLFGYIRTWENSALPDEKLSPRLEPGLYDKARLERDVYPYMIYDSRTRHMFRPLVTGYLWEKAFRRQLLLDHYLQDAAIPIFEDALIFYECLYNADSLAVCPDTLYIYLQRADSAVHRGDSRDICNIDRCRRYLDDHLLRQAPQLRPQTDMFFAAQLHWTFIRLFRSGSTPRQAVGELSGPLRQTALASHLTHVRQPFYRLLVFLLQKGLLYPALVLTWAASRQK